MNHLIGELLNRGTAKLKPSVVLPRCLGVVLSTAEVLKVVIRSLLKGGSFSMALEREDFIDINWG